MKFYKTLLYLNNINIVTNINCMENYKNIKVFLSKSNNVFNGEQIKNAKNLQKIRSTYFINNIFNFIHPVTQLKIAKYNKSIQNKIGIRPFLYKNASIRFTLKLRHQVNINSVVENI